MELSPTEFAHNLLIYELQQPFVSVATTVTTTVANGIYSNVLFMARVLFALQISACVHVCEPGWVAKYAEKREQATNQGRQPDSETFWGEIWNYFCGIRAQDICVQCSGP